MTLEQFNALAQLLRLGDNASKRAAQMVLVDGATQSAAAHETGLTIAGANNAVQRCRKGLALASLAAGLSPESGQVPE